MDAGQFYETDWPKPPEPTEEEQLKQKLYDAYVEACDAAPDPPGFYYREVEEVGLLHVYNIGIEAGKAMRNEHHS